MTPETAPPVAVVILNWNSWPDTLECLESVFRLDYPNLHAILCDNGSTDASEDRIAAWARGEVCVLPEAPAMAGHSVPPAPRPAAVRMVGAEEARAPADFVPGGLTVIRNGANLGFAAGNNTGLAHALAMGARYIWLLNADTVAAPGALAALVARAGADPGLGLTGSLLCYYHAPGVIQEAGGCAYYPLFGIARRLAAEGDAACAPEAGPIERRLGYVSAASCLVSRQFLEEVGPLSENYFLYCEEIDWATRGRGAFRLGFAPDSVVWHKKGKATGSKSVASARSPASAYYLWRARRRFTRRFYPWGLPGLAATWGLAMLAEVLRGRSETAWAILAGFCDRPARWSGAGPTDGENREDEAGH